MVEVVNIVAGGDLGKELDLPALFSHFESLTDVQANFNPESSSALQLRFEENAPLCMIYRSGKFIITGAEDENSLVGTFERLVEEFQALSIVNEDDVDLTIYNKVFTGDLDQNIELSRFTIYIGLENVEYEPEQAPFLTYRSVNEDGVITLASTGKMVINGVRTEEEAKHLVDELKEKVKRFLQSDVDEF